MRIAILDPAAGISGDMTLGALLALGVPQSWLEGLPARLGLEGVAVTVRNAVRCGVGASKWSSRSPSNRTDGTWESWCDWSSEHRCPIG